MNEINKDYYCSADWYKDGWCTEGDCVHVDSCSNCFLKHPTPKQFKEKYGYDVPDDMAVYRLSQSGEGYYTKEYWQVTTYKDIREDRRLRIAVVACTPFVPSKEWNREQNL